MSIEKKKYIMVYIETVKGTPINASLESLTQASHISKKRGEQVVAIFIGSHFDLAFQTAISFGADEVLCLEENRKEEEIIAEKLFQIKNKYNPSMIFIAATAEGKDIGAMLASKSRLPAFMNVVTIREEEGNVIFTLALYSGNVLKEVKINAKKVAIAILRAGICKKEKLEGKIGSIRKESTETTEAKIKIVDTVKEVFENINLEEATVIVAGGRGMGSKENFRLVNELAKLCGGVSGATRPAIEENWIPKIHQIGQSGKMVAPKLYIACGISGATQHVSGILNSNFIVAINKDEEAPIFEVSDIGIVGNVLEILPLMIEEIKKIKAPSL